jgi:hypothetical protein
LEAAAHVAIFSALTYVLFRHQAATYFAGSGGGKANRNAVA